MKDVNVYFKYTGYDRVDWIKVPQIRVMWWARIKSVTKYRVDNYKLNILGMDYGIT
jgi:hypothetical protein